MTTDTVKPYDRRDGEDDLYWLAFNCYRDLGPGRTLEAAYTEYFRRKGKARKSKGISSSFHSWSIRFAWDERCRAWDDEAEARMRVVRQAQEEEKYLAEIGDYRDMQIRGGKAGVAAAVKAMQLIAVYLSQNPSVDSIADAERLARIAGIAKESALQWARGLHIEELLKEIQDELC